MTSTAGNRGRPLAACIVIGSSSGGFLVLPKLLAVLPESYPIPLILVSHLAADFDNSGYTHYLQTYCRLPVREPDDKEPVTGGAIYLAAPGYHLMVEYDRTFAFSINEKEHFCRPSIDVLFTTVARAFGNRAVGVILTGANSDGARGLKAIRDAGGLCVVQDPEEAEFAQMPRAAADLVQPEYVMGMEAMGRFLLSLAQR